MGISISGMVLMIANGENIILECIKTREYDAFKKCLKRAGWQGQKGTGEE